jgi:hypothetical protein
MFESLGDKLESVFKTLKGKGYLKEEDVDTALKEVRVALLEADVNYKVVKDFVKRVREQAVGKEVLESLTPGQNVVKIVHNELKGLLGGETRKVQLAPNPPTILMLVGLQGSGKTTTAAHARCCRPAAPGGHPAAHHPRRADGHPGPPRNGHEGPGEGMFRRRPEVEDRRPGHPHHGHRGPSPRG